MKNRCILHGHVFVMRANFWKAKTGCYTQVAVLTRFSQQVCHTEIIQSVRFITKLLYIEDQAVYFTNVAHFMFHYTMMKTILYEHFIFFQVCAYMYFI